MFFTCKPEFETTKAVVILSTVITLFPGIVRAAHPLITEDTGTQGRGKFQLELTAENELDDTHDVREETVAMAAVLSYGLRNDTDVILTLPREHVHTEAAGTNTTESGRADASLDFKWRFFEKKPEPCAQVRRHLSHWR